MSSTDIQNDRIISVKQRKSWDPYDMTAATNYVASNIFLDDEFKTIDLDCLNISESDIRSTESEEEIFFTSLDDECKKVDVIPSTELISFEGPSQGLNISSDSKNCTDLLQAPISEDSVTSRKSNQSWNPYDMTPVITYMSELANDQKIVIDSYLDVDIMKLSDDELLNSCSEGSDTEVIHLNEVTPSSTKIVLDRNDINPPENNAQLKKRVKPDSADVFSTIFSESDIPSQCIDKFSKASFREFQEQLEDTWTETMTETSSTFHMPSSSHADDCDGYREKVKEDPNKGAFLVPWSKMSDALKQFSAGLKDMAAQRMERPKNDHEEGTHKSPSSMHHHHPLATTYSNIEREELRRIAIAEGKRKADSQFDNKTMKITKNEREYARPAEPWSYYNQVGKSNYEYSKYNTNANANNNSQKSEISTQTASRPKTINSPPQLPVSTFTPPLPTTTTTTTGRCSPSPTSVLKTSTSTKAHEPWSYYSNTAKSNCDYQQMIGAKHQQQQDSHSNNISSSVTSGSGGDRYITVRSRSITTSKNISTTRVLSSLAPSE